MAVAQQSRLAMAFDEHRVGITPVQFHAPAITAIFDCEGISAAFIGKIELAQQVGIHAQAAGVGLT